MRIWTVRLIGVLLVLALGVAVGAGPLQKSNQRRDDDLTAQKRAVERKERQISALRAAGRASAAYAAATAPGLVRGALSGRSVTLVALPGADEDVVAGVRDLIAAAGGQVAGTVTFAPVMARSSSRQLVEALTSQMAAQNPALEIPSDAGGYERFGLLLARAVGLSAQDRKATATYDDISVGIVSGLTTANLVTAEVKSRAALTLAITGPGATSKDAAGENAVPTTILRAYATRAPLVVAGPASAGGPLGILGSLRASAVDGLSTVDTADTTAGQVTAVLALAALTRGTSGSWGAVGAKDGPIPPLP